MPNEQHFDPDLAEIAERLRQTPTPEALRPIVKRTRECLVAVAKKQTEDSLIWATCKQPVLDVGVGRSSIDRATRLLNALVAGLEAAGFRIDGHTVSGFGVTIRVRLREKTSQVPHRPKKGASQLEIRMAPKFDYVPNGILGLEFGDQFNAWSTRRSVWETKTCPLEDFMRGVPFQLLSEVQLRRDRQAAVHLAEEKAALKRREQERLEAERQEVEKLLQEADRWRRVQNLRSYLAAVREALGPACEGGDVGRWLGWAEGVAERSDPVRVVERMVRDGGATLLADDC